MPPPRLLWVCHLLRKAHPYDGRIGLAQEGYPDEAGNPAERRDDDEDPFDAD